MTALRSKIFIACLVFITTQGVAQTNFAHYLLMRGRMDEALLYMQSYSAHKTSAPTYDSLLFIKGLVHYNLQQPDSAAHSFLQIRTGHAQHKQAIYLAAGMLIQAGREHEAGVVLADSHAADISRSQMYHTMQCGIALLLHNAPQYEYHVQQFNFAEYHTTVHQQKLMELHRQQLNYAPLKPALAGIMSAVVPGAGKWYSGNRGEALAALFTVAGLGALAYDNYKHMGAGHWRTWATGGMFLVFYSGNITGSYHTARRNNAQHLQNYHEAIRYHIHMPVRSLIY